MILTEVEERSKDKTAVAVFILLVIDVTIRCSVSAQSAEVCEKDMRHATLCKKIQLVTNLYITVK